MPWQPLFREKPFSRVKLPDYKGTASGQSAFLKEHSACRVLKDSIMFQAET
jgi:hypothetical protein